MAASAQAGTIGFGAQTAKESAPSTWYRHRATMVDLAVNDPTAEGPPEVGGRPLPTFPYKTGPIVAGGLTIQPRFEDTLGWLLYGLIGDLSSAESPGASGLYNHTFTLLSGDETFVPWMGFRKHIPRVDGGAATDLGEQYTDCKILGGALALPNDSPLSMRLDVLGRTFELNHDPTAWTWAADFEDWQSIPVACAVGGYLKFDAVEMPVIAASVGFQNVPLDLRQEKVYGDPFLDGITVVGRRLAFDFTVKWENPDLYASILTGSTIGTEWTSAPTTGSFEVKAVSSVNMPSETEPYSLIISGTEVMLSQVGGIQLAGNQAVLLRYSGVALDNASYISFVLRNKVTSYTWPVGS